MGITRQSFGHVIMTLGRSDVAMELFVDDTGSAVPLEKETGIALDVKGVAVVTPPDAVITSSIDDMML